MYLLCSIKRLVFAPDSTRYMANNCYQDSKFQHGEFQLWQNLAFVSPNQGHFIFKASGKIHGVILTCKAECHTVISQWPCSLTGVMITWIPAWLLSRGTGIQILDPFQTPSETIQFETFILLFANFLPKGDFLEGIFEMTYCNWVQLWDEITIQQKEFLARLDYLKHCKTCTVSFHI